MVAFPIALDKKIEPNLKLYLIILGKVKTWNSTKIGHILPTNLKTFNECIFELTLNFRHIFVQANIEN
jgi:hypothetical protein